MNDKPMLMAKPSLVARIDGTGVPQLLARLVVGALFVYLAVKKIQDPITFLKLIRQYKMIDEQNAYVVMNLIAVALPWIELTCGLALILGVAVRGAALTGLGMLLAFTPLIARRGWELFQQGAGGAETFCGVKFDCGCGAGEVWVCNKLAENGFLMLLTLVALLSRSQKCRLSNVLARRSDAH